VSLPAGLWVSSSVRRLRARPRIAVALCPAVPPGAHGGQGAPGGVGQDVLACSGTACWRWWA
ncbi:hypothetical protein K7G98_36945, partial [Saccharothrix sp. MB29]|nr:hypothetical protein [Saccharothrix sp. MB29]